MKRLSFIFVLVFVVAVAMILGACSDSSDNSSAVNGSNVDENSSLNVSDSSVDGSESVNNDVSADISSGDESDIIDASNDGSIADDSDVSNESDSSEESDMSDYSNVSEDSSEEESLEPEVVGSGTEADPYLVIPDEDMHVVTVNIPAGKDVYYNIYRVGGMNLKIKSKDVYIIYDGKTYNPKSGSLSLSIEDAMASEAISFRIGNNGSSEQSFELVFSNPTGSYMNPTIVDDLKDEQFVELAANDEVGHYYKYVAEKNGTIVFAMSATADSEMLVTNNRNSAQRTTEDEGTKDSNGVKYVEIEVQKGDEIIINVGAIPNRRGKYPATDITWSAEYK